MAADLDVTYDRELDAEQQHIDLAYRHLDRMRAKARQLLSEPLGDPDLEANLKRRVFELTDTGRPLCFGRIDEENGAVWHIGRRHVEDANADPVVVEWRTPVAVPFYRATIEDPIGLAMRRQFVLEGRTLVQIADDLFGDTAAARAAEGPQVRGRDALLAELDRARGGQMLDIVATIQAEQDVVIRAPMEGILCVQGGPGTGKTAIGLHRAAYLLYGNETLARAGVLVVGPNRTFLRYIAQVLPALGEEAVVQTTLVDLVSAAPVRAVDRVETARIKGDARMATVLRRALLARRRPVENDLEVARNLTRVVVERDTVNDIFETVAARRVPYADGRRTLRDLLARAVYDRSRARAAAGGTEVYQEAFRAMTTSAPFRAAVDRLWPNVSATQLVREVLTKKARLATAADGVLDPEEQRLLLRRSARSLKAEPWTEADGPLVDEAVELIDGRPRTYGHAVVDEVQDWSPMQARMLARRVPSGSITMLGDIAQGAGVWGRDDWDDLLGHLPSDRGIRHEELRLGYRAPARVLEVASRLLPAIAPDLQPTESIRAGRSEPRFIEVAAPEHLAGQVASEARRLTADWPSVAVIVPAPLHDEVERALTATAGVDLGDAERQGLGHAVTLVPAATSRGLEFDAVVVVEPARIIDDAPRGLRLLYIALTRPTQHLTVMHARPLPAALRRT